MRIDLIRARYLGKEYRGVEPTGEFRVDYKYILAEVVCKSCGKTFWTQAARMHILQSCGCLHRVKRDDNGNLKRKPRSCHAKPKQPPLQRQMEAKWLGQQRGNWLCIGGIRQEDGSWMATVRCIKCGTEFDVKLQCFYKRGNSECSCKKMLAIRESRERQAMAQGHMRTPLELIWPA